MIDFEDLPREPTAAYSQLLGQLNSLLHSFSAKSKWPPGNMAQAIGLLRMLEATTSRLKNPADYDALLTQLEAQLYTMQSTAALGALRDLERLFYANSFDSHFIPQEDEAAFNTVNWEPDDRRSVLDALSHIRGVVSFSDDFEPGHKRRILYWVSKAENETFREKGTFSSILAATDEIVEAAASAGKKAEPLIKLIQGIRTTTKRNVTVHQIEAEEKPKQIAPPSD